MKTPLLLIFHPNHTHPLIYTGVCIALMVSFTFGIRLVERIKNRRRALSEDEQND
jgi:hypothetical protein